MTADNDIVTRLDLRALAADRALARTDAELFEEAAAEIVRLRGEVALAAGWHLESLAPAEAKGEFDAAFAEWLATEMPAGTVIGNPKWWAERIARQYRVRCTPQPAGGEAVAWQSMDTAPRDGTVIHLRWGHDGISPGWWSAPVSPIQNEDGTWPTMSGYPWAFVDKNNGRAFVNHARDNAYGPTHWAPYDTTPPAAQDGWDAQAYAQLRDTVTEWQRRALDAEATIQRLTDEFNAENGPAHMGEAVITPAAQVRHKFWGAGEADCPREIKAGNGELHTLRCKACGLDNPDGPCTAAQVQQEAVGFDEWMDRDWPLWRNDESSPAVLRLRRCWDATYPAAGDKVRELPRKLREEALEAFFGDWNDPRVRVRQQVADQIEAALRPSAGEGKG